MSLNGKTVVISDLEITNKAPWPTMPIQVFIDNFRLPAEYHQDVIKEQLTNALLYVNDELDSVRELIEPSLLEDLDQPEVGGVKQLVHDYQRAVMHCARAHLIWLFETVNRKDAAEIQGERSDENFDYWMQQCFVHIDRLRKAILITCAPKIDDPPAASTFADGFYAGLI